MQSNIARKFIFAAQTGFFLVLVSSAVLLSLFNSPTSAESSKSLLPVAVKQTIAIQPAPAYGSVSAGIYVNDPNPKEDETLIGQKVSVLSWFVHWNETMDNKKLAYACSHGYVPQITWESRKGDELRESTYTLDDIIASKYDQFITDELTAVKKTCQNQTVIIRFDHEMDTILGRVGWYPWQGDPEKYVAAWQHVVSIGHTISPDTIKWLWSPNRGVEVTKQYYPGDEWVDYAGITINRNPKQFRYTDFGKFYEDNRKVIESFGKPIIISETTYDLAGGTPEGKTAWIESMANYISTNPNIVSVSWFTSREGQSFNSNPESVTAIQNAFATLEPKQ